jgi:hypothetical protein
MRQLWSIPKSFKAIKVTPKMEIGLSDVFLARKSVEILT